MRDRARRASRVRTHSWSDREEHEKSINLTASWAETEAFEFWLTLGGWGDKIEVEKLPPGWL